MARGKKSNVTGGNLYRGVDLTKDLFTTYEVGRICASNIASVKNWVAKGMFGGRGAFRTPGGHIRIHKTALKDFLVKYPFAPGAFDNLSAPVFYAGRYVDNEYAKGITATVQKLEDQGMNIRKFVSGLDLITEAATNQPKAVIIDYENCPTDVSPELLADHLNRDCRVIIYYEKEKNELVKTIFAGVTFVEKSFRYANLIEAV